MPTRTRLWPGTKILTTQWNAGIKLTVHHCGNCGTIFAVTTEFDQQRRMDHHSFECPWCNASFTYGQESDLEKERRLRKEAERLRDLASDRAARQTARADQARADARAQKARGTRFKNERDRERQMSHAGQCPVRGCRRHFANLERHMASKHPDYEREEA